MKYMLLLLTVLTVGPSLAMADEPAPTESDYYKLSTFETPEGAVVEASGFQMLPNGKLAICTRRGEIWLMQNPFVKDVKQVKWTRFAHGMHEPLSLAYRDGWLYAVQRCEVTRMKDTNGDEKADVYETFNNDWGITGDYHEYAFGSKFDENGDMWVTLCLTGSFTSRTKYRGWCLRITPEGKAIPTCSGIRSPGGMGMNAAGDVFYTDNQGPWNGTCALKHLKPGAFVGNPTGFPWYDEPAVQQAMGKQPQEPQSGSRFVIEADKIPEYEPPAVLFPYNKMGKSASGIDCDTTGGKFGPFENQMFVGDQTHSTVMRVFMEQVDGHYQGACFPFREGIGSGTLSVQLTEEGSMFVGSTNRGWGSRGTEPFAVERLDWTGKTPFEILEMKADPEGFRLVFTEPVNPETAAAVDSYKMTTYTYIYQSAYGSPEVDHTEPTITAAEVSEDGREVLLKVDGLQRGHVHELHVPGVRSKNGLPLLHQEAYYTLNYLKK